MITGSVTPTHSTNYEIELFMALCVISLDDNLAYVTEHRWPPLSYEQAMEQYRREYLENEEPEVKGAGRKRRGVMNRVLGLVDKLRL